MLNQQFCYKSCCPPFNKAKLTYDEFLLSLTLDCGQMTLFACTICFSSSVCFGGSYCQVTLMGPRPMSPAPWALWLHIYKILNKRGFLIIFSVQTLWHIVAVIG